MDDLKKQEYIHEALDRVHIASRHFQMILDDHPVIYLNKQIEVLYADAIGKIEELYQLIGKEMS